MFAASLHSFELALDRTWPQSQPPRELRTRAVPVSQTEMRAVPREDDVPRSHDGFVLPVWVGNVLPECGSYSHAIGHFRILSHRRRRPRLSRGELQNCAQ